VRVWPANTVTCQDSGMQSPPSSAKELVLTRLSTLRQHHQQGQRSPHKPLLVLLALGRLVRHGTSEIGWSVAERELAELIRDYGRPTSTPPVQRAAYPFTHLRSDDIWVLDHDVPMDKVRPLREHQVVGRFPSWLEDALRDPDVASAAARQLVETEFPPTIAPDVLMAVGLDPDYILGGAVTTAPRRRLAAWPAKVLAAWDRQCAFCGFDGQLGGAPVGVEAAHVRWFNFGGPDNLDNGLALCSLHHKLFDRGALGLDRSLRITVSADYSSRTSTGKGIYELHQRPLQPRPGTTLPAAKHVDWHAREVFKAPALG
jgi:putative restriction endonuclease